MISNQPGTAFGMSRSINNYRYYAESATGGVEKPDHRIGLGQLVADFRSAPAGMLPYDPQNRCFHLEGQLVGMPVRTSGAILQSPETVILIAIEQLVASLARDTC